jgi:hypothetical protein
MCLSKYVLNYEHHFSYFDLEYLTSGLTVIRLGRVYCTRNVPVGKGRPAREADNLTATCESIVYKMWEPRRLTTVWASTACYRDSFT